MTNPRNQLVINLLRVGAFLTREGNRIAAKYGLNQQQFVVLNYIMNNQPVNQNQICSSLVFEKSNVSKIVKKLKQLNLISVEGSDVDKRSLLLELTPAGEEIIKAGLNEFNSFNNQLLSNLSEEDITLILSSTGLLIQSILPNK